MRVSQHRRPAAHAAVREKTFTTSRSLRLSRLHLDCGFQRPWARLNALNGNRITAAHELKFGDIFIRMDFTG
jgi:hypothetical protein